MDREYSKYKIFVEEARKLIYGERDFKGKTYAEKVKFLKGVQRDLINHQGDFEFIKSGLESRVWDFVNWVIDDEIAQTEQEALDLPIKDKK